MTIKNLIQSFIRKFLVVIYWKRFLKNIEKLQKALGHGVKTLIQDTGTWASDWGNIRDEVRWIGLALEESGVLADILTQTGKEGTKGWLKQREVVKVHLQYSNFMDWNVFLKLIWWNKTASSKWSALIAEVKLSQQPPPINLSQFHQLRFNTLKRTNVYSAMKFI